MMTLFSFLMIIADRKYLLSFLDLHMELPYSIYFPEGSEVTKFFSLLARFIFGLI